MATIKIAPKKKSAAKAKASKSTPEKSVNSSRRRSAATVDTKGKSLVIVESPAKARTIGRFLGSEYVVMASMGHIRDLPSGKLGVDIENDFLPLYEIMKDKKVIAADLKKAGADASTIYLATDSDREGEAIAWHLREASKWKDIPIKRVVFHAITPEAIDEAFKNDREIDMRLVNAQQARRILDRLFGYLLSPVLWKKVQRGLSAGRVQSPTVRLVVERDAAIDAFVPIEYWSIDALVQPDAGSEFKALLHGLAGDKRKIELPDQASVDKIVADLEGTVFEVSGVTKREMKRRPSAPFITSTLQQDAARQLGFQARRTMSVAQQLYEGIDVGGTEGSVGLITYMRTDSTQVDHSAITETRNYVEQRWGKEYIPNAPRLHSTKSKVAQEAHEAIRPTSPSRAPEVIRERLSSDQFKLYELIWKRMVASQMSDAVLDSTQIEIASSGRSGQAYEFKASGSVLKFPGFRTLYIEAKDDDSDEDAQDKTLPLLAKGQTLKNHGLQPDQHFTQPPPRFTEASLIKTLEERGVGRPSTYAPTIGTIVDRQYVSRERASLQSGQLGQVVTEQLVAHFPTIMNINFTAGLEEQLDDVANGKQEWIPVLKDFYDPFKKALDEAQENMPRVRVEEKTDEICTEEGCGKPMVIKTGRFGKFMACTGFPECKHTKPLLKKTGALCPKDNCNGDLVERKGKGRIFFGCTNYPECDFTVTKRPLRSPCPECEGLLLTIGRNLAACTNCVWEGEPPEEETDAPSQ
jgi:DNA topoisomerase-1